MNSKKEPYNLFLDDHRTPGLSPEVAWLPKVKWAIVRSFEEFVEMIVKKGLPQMVSFDHDLSPNHYPEIYASTWDNPYDAPIPYESFTEKTGYHCALWMINYCKKHKTSFPVAFVHSINPMGARNIKELLKKEGFGVNTLSELARF